MTKQLRILILMAKTGGGHGATATAIEEALVNLYRKKVYVKVVDGLNDFAPFPINHLDISYPWQLKISTPGYAATWKASNNTTFTKQFMKTMWPIVKNASYKIMRKKYDCIVATHPAFVYPCLTAREKLKSKTKFVSVVPDLAVSHAIWCDWRTDLLLAPTQEAANEAIRHGVSSDKVKITGLPIRLNFLKVNEPKNSILKSIGLAQNKKTILLMGGGEGIGKILEIAKKINSSKINLQLIVVAGKNSNLLKKLNSLNWKIPHLVFGLTLNIPQLMRASDILITKGGPTTLAEGMAMGLPIIVFDYIPNQESKNVIFLTNSGAGKLIKNPTSIIKTLKSLLTNEKLYKEMSMNSKKAAKPKSAFTAAKLIYDLVSLQGRTFKGV